MSSNSFKVKNSLVLTPKDLTTLVSPEAGDIACDINDNNKIKKYDAVTSSWSEVGSGAASLDNIFQLIGDDVSSWSKGNNAVFLGGGSLAGTFATESAAPLNGLQSYKYTQAAGSLNDYIASPVKSVPARFRGQTCILSFPFNYNGSTNDIEVVLYDVTNSAIIPNSMFITSSSTTSVLTSYITIPTTCSSIRVGFKVAVANSGKILNFDDVQLSQTSLYTPQPESQSSYLNSTTSFTNTTITGALTSSVNSGIFSYNSSTGVYTILKTARISAHVSMNTTAAAYTQAEIRVDNVVVAQSLSNNNSGYFSTTSYSGILSAGQTITFLNNSATASSVQKVSLLAQASSSAILLAPETFSTDTAALTYAGSGAYTLSTLANAPVGTYITFTYAINTNTRTQTTTRPTQTDADMNSNGIHLYSRAYNAASTAALPSAIAIQIGKGLKGITRDWYASSGKVNSLNDDFFNMLANVRDVGVWQKSYNELTGILTVDAGLTSNTSCTTHFIGITADLNTPSDAYLVINASKNPALTAVSTTRTGTLLRITRFTSSGTWTLPNDVGSIVVEVQGGGGAGGSGNSPGGGGGGAGGAGGYSQKLISRSSLGATETVTVGAASGTSSFGAHCSATGGSSGGGANSTGGAGGAGSGGDINLNGNGGAGGSNAGTGGAGGASPRFGGAAIGDASGVGTAAVANSGSGGSGGYSGAGGAGATGVVVVYEYSV